MFLVVFLNDLFEFRCLDIYIFVWMGLLRNTVGRRIFVCFQLKVVHSFFIEGLKLKQTHTHIAPQNKVMHEKDFKKDRM